jgi:hypothetical protein
MEWVRFLEAACNGCVVLSEPCIDHEPLVPGEHFLAAKAASLALVADQVLDDPDRLRRVRLQSYDYVRERMQMGPSVERLAAVAAETIKRADVRSEARPGGGEGKSSTLPPRPEPPPAITLTPEAQELQTLGQALRALCVETRELRRNVADLAYRQRTGKPPDLEICARTPAYAEAAPRVTILMTVYNYAREVIDALGSVAASRFAHSEVLVLDDASTDGSADAAAGFLSAHPWLPAMLLRRPANRGLAQSRNDLLAHARGEYVFILDADNGIYPTALSHLTKVLDEDDDAMFAYPMIAAFRTGAPFMLISALPWESMRLRHGNYIDAMALIRRRELVQLGGYVTDPRLTGWEDFYLWCQCAESGRRGVLVPQVLAWYRRTAHSMLIDTETNTTTAWSLMRERFPALLEAEPLTSVGS